MTPWDAVKIMDEGEWSVTAHERGPLAEGQAIDRCGLCGPMPRGMRRDWYLYEGKCYVFCCQCSTGWSEKLWLLGDKQGGPSAVARLYAAQTHRLQAELDARRMCLTCGKIAPNEIARTAILDECKDAHGWAPCLFDMTPDEAWQHWRQIAHDQADTIRSWRRSFVELFADLMPYKLAWKHPVPEEYRYSVDDDELYNLGRYGGAAYTDGKIMWFARSGKQCSAYVHTVIRSLADSTRESRAALKQAEAKIREHEATIAELQRDLNEAV